MAMGPWTHLAPGYLGTLHYMTMGGVGLVEMSANQSIVNKRFP